MAAKTSGGGLNGQLVIDNAQIQWCEKIGEGGCGTVFRAEHSRLGELAIKKLSITCMDDGKTAEKLKREATFLTNLQHPNVINLCGILWQSPNYGIAMPFLPLGSLKSFIDVMSIDWEVKLEFLQQICTGMLYLHSLERGSVVHGDMKIENVLVDNDLTMKISDFGLSSWRSFHSSVSLKTVGSKLSGSVTHIPPECWKDLNRKPDEKRDVYGFAILCWEVVTEKFPYEGCNADVIALGVKSGQRPAEKDIPKEIPKDLIKIIKKCWENNPDKRASFQSTKGTLESLVKKNKKMVDLKKEAMQEKVKQRMSQKLARSGSSVSGGSVRSRHGNGSGPLPPLPPPPVVPRPSKEGVMHKPPLPVPLEAYSAGQRESSSDNYLSLQPGMDQVYFTKMVHALRSFDDNMYGVDQFCSEILPMVKEDIMVVYDEIDDKFLRVKRFSDCKLGIVHVNNVLQDDSVESMSWFHGPVSASEAGNLLRGAYIRDGTFLLRHSSESSAFSLSVKYGASDKGVLHYRIGFESENGYSLGAKKTFKHLFQLIAYYQYPESVADGCLKHHLTVPLRRAGPLPLRQIKEEEISVGPPVHNTKHILSGRWNNVDVVLKTWRPSKNSKNDINGIGNLLLHCQHVNVIKLYGISQGRKIPPSFVLGCVMKGELLSVLKEAAPTPDAVNEMTLMKIAQGVANGMTFLESKNILHNNLKASNILINELTSANRTVKICGFSSAVLTKDGRIPPDGRVLSEAWCAPEVLNKSVGGSHKADVFSFGVLVVEIFTFGATPHADISTKSLKAKILEGHRLQCPPKFNKTLWDTSIMRCWQSDPAKRPSFVSLQDSFDDYIAVSDTGDYETLKNYYNSL